MQSKVSIAIPIVDSPKTAFFVSRLLNSLAEQTFTDYEIVITKAGAMAHNHNEAIKQSKGQIIKLMQMDDYFGYPDALKDIVDNFSGEWMITGCAHTIDGINVFNPHYPTWNDKMYTGNNTLGGFSTLVVKNDNPLLLEEPLTWVVDCDLYQRYFNKFGLPILHNKLSVVVDVGEHRLSSTLSNELKAKEIEYLIKKYG